MNIEELKKPLDPKHVAQRTQNGMKLSYIEGWHAIDEANRIFGFNGWNRETIGLTCVAEPEQYKNEKGVELWRVGYIAKVKITVNDHENLRDIVREGTGYGSGTARVKGDACESAVKEAETDAMKRALMTFGNPFGLALYDKTQANVQAPPPPAPVPTAEEIDFRTKTVKAFASATTPEGMDCIWKEITPKMKAMGMCAEVYEEIKQEFIARKSEIVEQTKDAA